MLVSTCWLVVSCASPGTPDGGRFDEEPPYLVRATPGHGSVNASTRKVRLYFNEFIKLDNPNEKVTVSPPQEEMPVIMAEGKHIRVDLKDSLKSNTTYTIDFSDAISDNNEGNPMGLFTYSFSTGDVIDTMEVSGVVLDASNLEPIKGILVGLYDCSEPLPDSIFRTMPLQRVGRTNGSGRFTIKGVKNGRYRAFALKDMDGDYRFSQKSEMVAFDTASFVTSCRPDLRPDTIWRDTSTYEKIRMVPYIHYFPDNLVLMAFLEGGQDRHLLKMERPLPEKFTLFFTAPCDSMPIIEGLNFDASKLIPEPTVGMDTITYWIPDTTIAYNDTLRFNLSYLDTDTLGQLTMRTDSLLEAIPKKTHEKLEKERQKKIEDWEKQQAKKRRRAEGVFQEEPNPFLVENITLQVRPSGAVSPNVPILLSLPEPILSIDSTRIHFTKKVDSLYVDCPYLLVPHDTDPKSCYLFAEWEPKARYQLQADSLTFRGVLGNYASSVKTELTVRGLNEFGSIFLKLNNLQLKDGETAYVELLNRSDNPVAKQVVEDGHADFFFLKPGDYYMRLFIDRDGDELWTTGDYDKQLQPEEVFYFPKPITLRALFEVEQAWDVRSIPRDKQKALAITKQKPDKARMVRHKNLLREDNTIVSKIKNNSKNTQQPVVQPQQSAVQPQQPAVQPKQK